MSDNVRASIYTLFTAVLGVLVAFGLINADEQTVYLEVAGQALAFLAMLMAAVKTWRQRGVNEQVPPAE